MQSNTENDLECIQIKKHFGPVRAVDDVSFEIPKGSFFSILGPSGCGKTTLMRMIAGFETPTSGDIRIKGKSVIGRRRTGATSRWCFSTWPCFR